MRKKEKKTKPYPEMTEEEKKRYNLKSYILRRSRYYLLTVYMSWDLINYIHKAINALEIRPTLSHFVRSVLEEKARKILEKGENNEQKKNHS